jgi:hypothetical protein
VLLRLGYLAVSNAFAVLRLLPMGERDKDVEILALRHQIAVLERQLRGQRVRFTASERAFLAALLRGWPRPRLPGRLRPLRAVRRGADFVHNDEGPLPPSIPACAEPTRDTGHPCCCVSEHPRMRGAVAMMARNKKQSHAGFLFGWFKACDQ